MFSRRRAQPRGLLALLPAAAAAAAVAVAAATAIETTGGAPPYIADGNLDYLQSVTPGLQTSEPTPSAAAPDGPSPAAPDVSPTAPPMPHATNTAAASSPLTTAAHTLAVEPSTLRSVLPSPAPAATHPTPVPVDVLPVTATPATATPMAPASATTKPPLDHGSVSGSFSADGISEDVLAFLGEEGVWRQVLCELDLCTLGAYSVLVGDEASAGASTRMLLQEAHRQSKRAGGQRTRDPYQTVGHGQHPRHYAVHGGDRGFLRGQDRAPGSEDEDEVSGRVLWQRQGSGRRGRRLNDIENFQFSVSLYGGPEEEGGEVTTGSQQAAAFVNSVADPVILAGIAANLSVQVDDLDFSGLTFLQGSNFSVEKEFDVGSVELSSVLDTADDDGDPGRDGTWKFALFLVVVTALWAACLCCYLKQRLVDPGKEYAFLTWLGTSVFRYCCCGAGKCQTASAVVASLEKKLAALDEGGGGDVDDSGAPEDEADRRDEDDAASLARAGSGRCSFARRFRSGLAATRRGAGGRRDKQAVVPRAESMESQRDEAELKDNTPKSESVNHSPPRGPFAHRAWAFCRGKAGHLSFCDSNSSSASDQSGESSDVSPGLETGNEAPTRTSDAASKKRGKLQEVEGVRRRPASDLSEPEREAEQPKPVARTAILAPQRHGPSYSEPKLSRVAEHEPVGQGGADTSESTKSSTTPTALIQSNYLELLVNRTPRRENEEQPGGTTSGTAAAPPAVAAASARPETGVAGGERGSSPRTFAPDASPSSCGASDTSRRSSWLTPSRHPGPSTSGSDGRKYDRGGPSSSLDPSFSDEEDDGSASSSFVSGSRDFAQQVEARRRSFCSRSSSVSNVPSEKEDRGSHGTGDSISTLLYNLSLESLSSLFEDDEDSSFEDDLPAPQEDRQHRKQRLGLTPPPKLGSPHSPIFV